MKVINIKDFCIPAQDADYDELSNFADEIAELATYPIEAEPVRRGRWIKHLFEREFDICSHCKTGTKRREYGVTDGGKEWVTEYSYKYCPYCGARMEEQE